MKPIIIEFVGLPGAGKSTVAKELFEKLSDKYIVKYANKFWAEPSFKSIKNKIRLIPCSLRDLKVLLLIIYNCFLIQPFNFSRIWRGILLYFTIKKTLHLKKDNCSDFLLLDQGIMQDLVSLSIPRNPAQKINHESIIKLVNLTNNYIVVWFEINKNESLKRIKKRKSNMSRFDSWSNLKAMHNLTYFEMDIFSIKKILERQGLRSFNVDCENSADVLAEQIMQFLKNYNYHCTPISSAESY